MAKSDQLPSVCFIAPKAYPLLAGDETIPLIGGAELQVVIVGRLLATRGWRVSMICLDFGQPERVVVDGITVFRAYRLDRGIPVLRFLWPRLASIWRCLNLSSADIYYQQTAGIWTGVMAAFCKFSGSRCVFAAASNPDLVPSTPRIKYFRDRWIYAFGLRNVDRIFVQNDEQARLCREHLGRESIRVPNCYEAPMQRAVEQSPGCILWVSTIRQLKRPELFLELARALPELSFCMIGGPGDGEHELFESIRVRAKAIGNLEFLGFQPFSQTEAQFDRATLFVNTSDSEGFPNTFLQAWARGIPTISFVDAGAHLEGSSVGVKANSLAEMLSAVEMLSANESARLEEGERGMEYVRRNHSPESIVKLYERIFMELAATKRSQIGPSSTEVGRKTSGSKR